MREAAEYGPQPSHPDLAPDSDPAGAHADRLLELADEIVVLSAHIQAAVAPDFRTGRTE